MELFTNFELFNQAVEACEKLSAYYVERFGIEQAVADEWAMHDVIEMYHTLTGK